MHSREPIITNTTFVAGVRGVGKSSLLKTYKSSAVGIEAEALQKEAVLIAKGRTFEKPLDWSLWEQPEIVRHSVDLIRQALNAKYPEPRESDKPLLVVGALLVRDSFRHAVLAALGERFPDQVKDTKLLVLHLEEQVISNQIASRGRDSERDWVGAIEKIREHRDGYWGIAEGSADVWEQIRDHGSLERALANRLGPSGVK